MGDKISDLPSNGAIIPAQTLLEIEQLNLPAGSRSRNSDLVTLLEFLLGSGWTTETIKDNFDLIVDLAGAGRTTESVKGNADKISSLEGHVDTFVLARRSTAQSIASGGSGTVILWDTETDPGNNYNPATGEYTVPSTGNYILSVNLDYANAAWVLGNIARLSFSVDGSFVRNIGTVIVQASNTFVMRSMGFTVARLNAGQKVTVSAFQNTGVAINTAGTIASDHFSICRAS